MIGTVKLYKPYMNSRKRMVKAMAKIAKQLTELIGNTPLLELTNYEKENELEANLIVKLEYFNPLGSVKDRVAYAMIEQGIADGKINSDTVIIEPTSGNTGIGLAFVTAAKGLHLILTMPDTMSVERRKIVAALGAEIVLTPGRDGMKGAIKKAEELKEEYGNAFIPQQFENEANPAIHKKTTAQEILKDTDGKVDIFVSAVGTGGTVTGTGQGLKEANPDVKVVAVEPAGSPVLSASCASFFAPCSSAPQLGQNFTSLFTSAPQNLQNIGKVLLVKIKMQERRANRPTKHLALTGAQKKYIHGSNYAIMKKKREGMRHEEGKA